MKKSRGDDIPFAPTVTKIANIYNGFVSRYMKGTNTVAALVEVIHCHESNCSDGVIFFGNDIPHEPTGNKEKIRSV